MPTSLQITGRYLIWTIVLGTILGMGGLTYLLLRIYNIPILNDEAISFFLYVDHGIFWPWGGRPDTNNHLLNTALTSMFCKVFGASAITLRLANVLGFLVYTIGCIKLALRQRAFLHGLAILLCLQGSPIFLEYFGYSRGYGLSFACLIMLINCLWKYSDKRTRTVLAELVVWMLLTLASNLSFIMPMLITTLWIIYLDFKGKMLKRNVLHYIAIAITISIFIGHTFWLKYHGALYHGNPETGFWDAAVESFLLSIAPAPYGWMQIFIALGLLGTFGMFIHRASSPTECLHPAQGISFVFLGSLLLFFFTHQLLDVNYPFGRVAVGFWIIGLLAFITSTTYRGSWKWTISIMLIVPVWSCTHASLDASTPWHGEQIPKAFMKEVALQPKRSKTPCIAGHPLRHSAWAFYNLTYEGTLGILWDIHPAFVNPDFQILKFHDFTAQKDSLYDILETDSISSTHLIRRKDWMNLHSYTIMNVNPPQSPTEEFTQLMKMPLAENAEHPAGVELTLDLKMEKGELFLCTFQQAEDGTTYDYYQYDIGRLPRATNRQTLCIPFVKTRSEPSNWIVHLWNPEKMCFSITQGKIEMLTYSE